MSKLYVVEGASESLFSGLATRRGRKLHLATTKKSNVWKYCTNGSLQWENIDKVNRTLCNLLNYGEKTGYEQDEVQADCKNCLNLAQTRKDK